jgi:small subunit ribosomal protein S1
VRDFAQMMTETENQNADPNVSSQPEPLGVSAESVPAPPDEVAAEMAAGDRGRVRIGSQRPTGKMSPGPALEQKKPKPRPAALDSPVTSVVARHPEPKRTLEKVAPPNVRQRLSEDLEAEFVEALGGGSVDTLLESAAPKVVSDELEPEARVTGKVLALRRDSAFIDLGGRRQGILALRDLPNVPEPGEALELIVSRFDSVEGLYEVMLPGGTVSVGDWSQVTEGMIVEARVTGHNKGGLECEVGGLRGFMPAGQVARFRVEDFSQFVGERLRCVVTEANPDRRNLVLSHRAVLEREQAEARETLLAELETGQTREGVVRSLQDFGAFVDLGGVDGLIHISQLSWERVKHASEVLEVGQRVKVRVQKIDPATGRIGLAFRDLMESPWERASTKYAPRSTAQGVVSRIMDFGAFVRLEPGVEGLVHISEISHKRVFRVADVLQEGQDVEVLVLSVDPEQQRMSLSLKALEAKPESAKKEEPEMAEALEAAPLVRRDPLKPLKGGLGKDTGGDKFGLKW